MTFKSVGSCGGGGFQFGFSHSSSFGGSIGGRSQGFRCGTSLGGFGFGGGSKGGFGGGSSHGSIGRGSSHQQQGNRDCGLSGHKGGGRSEHKRNDHRESIRDARDACGSSDRGHGRGNVDRGSSHRSDRGHDCGSSHKSRGDRSFHGSDRNQGSHGSYGNQGSYGNYGSSTHGNYDCCSSADKGGSDNKWSWNGGGSGSTGGSCGPSKPQPQDCTPPKPQPQDCTPPKPQPRPEDCTPSKPQPQPPAPPQDCKPMPTPPAPQPPKCDTPPKPQPQPPAPPQDCKPMPTPPAPKPPTPPAPPQDCKPTPRPDDCAPGKGDGGHGGGRPDGAGHGGGKGGAGGKDDCDTGSKWTVSDVKDGKATISLGDRYKIGLNENDGTWTVKDSCGSETKVWGDPHVDLNNDGKNEFDFKKDSTFRLDDGTKITVGTKPVGKDATMSSTLTITNGRNGIQVSGLADKFDGANNLKVDQTKTGGYALDKKTDDGAFTAQKHGSNWTIDGKAITQSVVNKKEAAAC